MVGETTTERGELSDADAAQARGLAYGLLADLLARGLTADNGEAARTSAPLRAALRTYPAGDLDAVAVEHQHAFGWAAPPFEGAYLDPERIIGGAATDALWATFSAAGFRPDVRSEDVEHLSTALRCLAFLSGAESDALEDEHAGAVERVRALSRALLDEHLLRWVPIFAQAVRRLERAFPTALVEQIESLLLLHRAALGGRPRSFSLPAAPPLLEDEGTGLREIGEHLATPATSGVMLSREDVARLGRGARVPRGFGDRTQLLVNLLRSAARFEALEPLLDALDDEIAAQIEALEGPRYADVAPLTAPWRERADATRRLLREVRRAATRFAADDAGTDLGDSQARTAARAPGGDEPGG